MSETKIQLYQCIIQFYLVFKKFYYKTSKNDIMILTHSYMCVACEKGKIKIGHEI